MYIYICAATFLPCRMDSASSVERSSTSVETKVAAGSYILRTSLGCIATWHLFAAPALESSQSMSSPFRLWQRIQTRCIWHVSISC